MIGEKIKTLRKEINITQADLAKALNVTRSAVALWETDKTDPDILNLIAIAKFFKISVDELLGVDEYYVESSKFNKQINNIQINQYIKK